MRIVVVYRERTDYTRDVEEYLHDFEHQTGHIVEVVNPDSPAGVQFCEAYGIVDSPTILAISDNSQMQNIWHGLPLPTISELSFYV